MKGPRRIGKKPIDIVRRLRTSHHFCYTKDNTIFSEAADEIEMLRCERLRTPLSRDLPFEGLAASEIGALAAEGAYQLTERKMDEKQMGVVRHVLTAVGAIAVYAGYTDDATWMTASGALATMVSFMWSWMSKE